jgi:hypothetical protein
MNTMRKFHKPLVWLVIAAVALGVGGGALGTL